MDDRRTLKVAVLTNRLEILYGEVEDAQKQIEKMCDEIEKISGELRKLGAFAPSQEAKQIGLATMLAADEGEVDEGKDAQPGAAAFEAMMDDNDRLRDRIQAKKVELGL